MLSTAALAMLRWIAAGDQSSPAPAPPAEAMLLMGELLDAGAIDASSRVTPLGREILEPAP